MNHIVFLRSFFICCFLFNLSFSQKQNKINHILVSKNITNNKKIFVVDSILQKLSFEKKSIKNETESYSEWLFENSEIQKSIIVSFLAIQNEKKNNTIDSLYLEKLYYRLGLLKYNLKAYDESITLLKTALQFNNKFEGEIYSTLGKCFHKKSDYYSAINHYKLGKSLLKKNNLLDALFKNYVNISQSYNSLQTVSGYKKARNYFLKADSITPFTNIGKKYRHYIQMGLADSYNYNEILDIPKASLYYQKALAISFKANDSINLGKIYSNYGNLYCTTNPDLAIEKQLKSLLFFSEKDSLQKSIIYSIIAYSHSIKGNYNKSIKNYLKSINLITGFNNDIIFFFKIKNKANFRNKSSLIRDIKALGSVYLKKYFISKEKEALKKSINTFLLADQLLDLILLESQEFQSKLFWRKQSAELYGKAIEACFASNDTKKAFYFMEKNKALLLTKGLKDEQIKQSLNLPDSLVNLEIAIKKNIYTLKKQESTVSNKDSITIALLAKERDLRSLQDSIQSKFTHYNPINLKTDIITLKELQQSLDNETAVLSYNISEYDDYGLITPKNNYTPVIKNCKYGVKTFYPGYGMLISKNKVDFFKLNTNSNTKSEVEKLITQMRSPFKTEADIKNYNKDAHKVYSTLFPSGTLRSRLQNKNLRIIPDNYLHYLPFEALKTSVENNAHYWIEENEISYAFSNSFLANIINSKINTATTTFAGFAPVNFEKLSLNPLQNSLKELNSVSNSFSGVVYTHENATKEKFLKILPKQNIIHLATHADAQDSISPWIAFKNQKLFQEELSLTTNHADMVVLSGCNTLLGKQNIGEGVMSLARGFFQSGAKSVVSSLWNVDDQSTSEIMKTFYKNLKKGQTKSKALQNAKINYLKNHSLSETSPFHWASFVVLGNTEPLTSPFNTNYLFIIVLVPFFLILLFLFQKKL